MIMKILYSNFISSSFVLFILRLWLGIIFLAHGSQKLLGWFGGKGLGLTIERWQTNMGIPSWLGYIAIFTEFFGAIALMTGFLTRAAALGIITVMSVAISINVDGGFFNPSGIEFQLTLLIIALAIFLYGPGRISVDNRINHKSQDFNEI